ncbi:MAG: nitroreductase [Candidatus Marinimicrobia bacterium]|nr:nitroreductase [Candidatus Neomarinimicrobiota bacterium]
MLTRRNFFKKILGLTILGSGISSLSKCSQNHSNLREIRMAKPPDNLNKKEYLTLQYAAMAPSGHNTQPWQIEIREPGKWLLLFDKSRQLPAIDPNNRELMLSLGAFLGNLKLAAKSINIDVSIAKIFSKSSGNKVAKLELKQNKPNETDHLTEIKSRRTHKNGILNKDIKPEDFRYITNNSEDINYISNNSKEGRILQELTIEANRLQVNRDEAQLELSNWIRWSQKKIRKFRDGLNPNSMGMKGIIKWYASHFFSKKTVMSKSFRKSTLKMVRKQVENCGGWLIITSPNYKPESLLNTGIEFEKMCLKTIKKKIAIHPMSQILEEKTKEKVNSLLNIDQPIQFIIRTGYLNKYKKPVSIRRPVEWFIINS